MWFRWILHLNNVLFRISRMARRLCRMDLSTNCFPSRPDPPLSPSPPGPVPQMRLQSHRRAAGPLPRMRNGNFDVKMRFFSLITRTVRYSAIAFLVLTGTWLTAAWIASHLWPADHALLQFFQNVNFANVNRRHFHFDVVDWPQSSRRLAVIFVDRSNDHPTPITKLERS